MIISSSSTFNYVCVSRFTSVVSRCWDASADKRPEFDVICSAIERFRGSGAPQDDYYTSDEAGGGQPSYMAMGQNQEL